MKPLMLAKITPLRRTGGDWISAAEQSTDAGRNEFWARQQERIKAAQSQASNVRPLQRKGKA